MQPWRNHTALQSLAQLWRLQFCGRKVFRIAGGDSWLRLYLEGDDRINLNLVARPGISLLWDSPDIPPRSVDDALVRIEPKKLSVTKYLRDATINGVGVLHEDSVFIIRFHSQHGAFYLLQQLFGLRGHLVLLDGNGVKMWWTGKPHPVCTRLPDESIFSAEASGSAEEFRKLAPDFLEEHLIGETTARCQNGLARLQQQAAKLVTNLTKDFDKAENGDLMRHYAETLGIHMHTISRGTETALLKDADGVELTIEMDPAKTPSDNMNRFFHLARKADRGKEIVAERLDQAKQKLANLEQLTDQLNELSTLEELLAWENEYLQKQIQAKKQVEEILPFRRFVIDGKWEVWVGRSSKENDELTHNASSRDDWWLHAQGVSGSHVILRTAGQPENVPNSVREKAAEIAAWFSKARNSSIVPVIITMRKYVRKPRKSLPGAASCEREKTIFVEPGLPDN
ncbi:MAG: DUF814 domain-containing protein [bacterium]|nr:DUF814 domain-containing protein [bacterium]